VGPRAPCGAIDQGDPKRSSVSRVAAKCLCHLRSELPAQAGYINRRWLPAHSTEVESISSRETVKRSALGDDADYGYRASHSRYLWGFGLPAVFAPDGTTRALTLASSKRDEREVVLELFARCRRTGGEILLDDRGHAGREFAHAVRQLDDTIVRPRRNNEAGHRVHLVPTRQRIKSIFWTGRDLLILERHGARTPTGVTQPIAHRSLCLVACVSLHHKLRRPSRARVDYAA
jgi:hypothetical protein